MTLCKNFTLSFTRAIFTLLGYLSAFWVAGNICTASPPKDQCTHFRYIRIKEEDAALFCHRQNDKLFIFSTSFLPPSPPPPSFLHNFSRLMMEREKRVNLFLTSFIRNRHITRWRIKRRKDRKCRRRRWLMMILLYNALPRINFQVRRFLALSSLLKRTHAALHV